MITYGAIQKALSGLNPSSWADDMHLIAKCMRTLAYCAEKDALAAVFRNSLSTYITVLQSLDGSNSTSAQNDGTSLADILFTIHPGKTDLHAAARDLLRFMHRPFGGLQKPPLQATVGNCMEAALGTHIEWQWELKSNNCVAAQMESKTVTEDEPMVDVQQQQKQQQHGLQGWTTWTPPAVMRVG
jgi:hypothetical protein